MKSYMVKMIRLTLKSHKAHKMPRMSIQGVVIGLIQTGVSAREVRLKKLLINA